MRITHDPARRDVLARNGRPMSRNLRRQIIIRLPADVIDKWRATGPGWMRRMAQRLGKVG